MTYLKYFSVIAVLSLTGTDASAQPGADLRQLSAALESLNSRFDQQNAELQSQKEALTRAKADLEKLKSTMPPVGAILAYFGEPTGPNWVLCDGRTTDVDRWKRVPDLRQKFLRGADDRDSLYRLGSGGGKDSVPNHWHVVTGEAINVTFKLDSIDGWIGSYPPVNAADGLEVDNTQFIVGRRGNDSHGHSGGTGTIRAKSDSDGGHDNRPAYTSVNFVCRIQ